MVKLRRVGNGKTYYARIRLPKNASKTERLITLKTTVKSIALKRLTEVKLMEDEIRNGYEFEFSWQNELGKTQLKYSTLGELTELYKEHRRTDIDSPVRDRTYQLISDQIKRLIDHFGPTKIVTKIGQADVDIFKKTLAAKYAIATTNVCLRNIATMWRWLRKQKYQVNDLSFKQIASPHQKPIYISNPEFDEIIKISTSFNQRIFNLYRDTGMRLREAFNGVIAGSFLIVPAHLSKGGREREIPLTADQVEVVKELQAKAELTSSSDKENVRKTSQVGGHYSRVFKDACVKLGIEGKSFKSLRHTAALRFYLMSNDIFYVAKMLGHSRIETTQIYTQFSLQRLAQDFPDLINPDENKFHHRTW